MIKLCSFLWLRVGWRKGGVCEANPALVFRLFYFNKVSDAPGNIWLPDHQQLSFLKLLYSRAFYRVVFLIYKHYAFFENYPAIFQKCNKSSDYTTTKLSYNPTLLRIITNQENQ